MKAEGATLGDALLFFGCRRPDQDFLYEDELKTFAANGLVGLHVAFSRLNDDKLYVQHLIAREADAVWRLIEQGAVIYVCGDGGKMEPDVKAALIALHQRKTGASSAQSAVWIDQMGRDNRYVLDVWASG